MLTSRLSYVISMYSYNSQVAGLVVSYGISNTIVLVIP